MRKCEKLRGVGPGFKVCKGLVVVLRKGVRFLEGWKSTIIDRENILQWYLILYRGSKLFLKVIKKSKS